MGTIVSTGYPVHCSHLARIKFGKDPAFVIICYGRLVGYVLNVFCRESLETYLNNLTNAASAAYLAVYLPAGL